MWYIKMFHTSLKPVKDYPCEGENKKKGKFFLSGFTKLHSDHFYNQ